LMRTLYHAGGCSDDEARPVHQPKYLCVVDGDGKGIRSSEETHHNKPCSDDVEKRQLKSFRRGPWKSRAGSTNFHFIHVRIGKSVLSPSTSGKHPLYRSASDQKVKTYSRTSLFLL